MAVDIKTVAARKLRISVPEAPWPVLRDALLSSARDFCRRTYAWRAVNEIDTTPNSYAYYAFLDTVADVVDFVLITNTTTGNEIKKKTPQQIVSEHGADLLTKVGEPEFAYLTGLVKNGVAFAPIPDDVYRIHLEFAVIPLADNTPGLDDQLWTHYETPIIHGAMANLLEIPDKSWSDPRRAAYHRAEFEAAIPIAKSRAADGNMTGVVRKVRYGGL